MNFDVGFTNIYIEKTMKIIENKYQSPVYIMILIIHRVVNINFIYKEQRYKKLGGAIDSPPSPNSG